MIRNRICGIPRGNEPSLTSKLGVLGLDWEAYESIGKFSLNNLFYLTYGIDIEKKINHLKKNDL